MFTQSLSILFAGKSCPYVTQGDCMNITSRICRWTLVCVYIPSSNILFPDPSEVAIKLKELRRGRERKKYRSTNDSTDWTQMHGEKKQKQAALFKRSIRLLFPLFFFFFFFFFFLFLLSVLVVGVCPSKSFRAAVAPPAASSDKMQLTDSHLLLSTRACMSPARMWMSVGQQLVIDCKHVLRRSMNC